MNINNKQPDRSAFAYCLRVLVFSVLITALLLGSTIYILMTYGLSTGTLQANIGILAIFIINIEILVPFLLVRQLIKPLEKLNIASEKLARGDFNVSLVYTGKISELETVFQNFQMMSEELASVETLRNDFVSNVSHEFKTPLTSIEGYATLLQNNELTDTERKEYTDHIISGTKRLSSLVSNILFLTKVESQNIQPEVSTYRLDEQVLQILLQQEPIWSQKDIEFELNFSEIVYSGSEQLLYHVWSNLISNAIKYSYPKGPIKIQLDKVKDTIVFTITDYGIGISEHHQRHIFEKFYQVDTEHKSQGNGLGLAQVKKILDLTGNQIRVRCNEISGTTFTVILNTK